MLQTDLNEYYEYLSILIAKSLNSLGWKQVDISTDPRSSRRIEDTILYR